MEMSNEQKESVSNNTLRSISGIVNQMEQKISDAIGVARTAVEQSSDEVQDTRMGALWLVWYKLEKIQAAHARIANICPPCMRIEETEGRPS